MDGGLAAVLLRKYVAVVEEVVVAVVEEVAVAVVEGVAVAVLFGWVAVDYDSRLVADWMRSY